MRCEAKGFRVWVWLVELISVCSVLGVVGCGASEPTTSRGQAAAEGVNPFEGLRIDQTVRLGALTGRVDAVVDAHGIQHVYAQNDHDAIVVQGYLCAHERLFEIEVLRRIAAGRLSELVGEIPGLGPVAAGFVARELDLYYRTIFTSPRGGRLSREVLDALPAEAVEVLQAYCDGINAYLADLAQGRNRARMPTQFLGPLLPVDPGLIPEYTPESIVDLALFFLWFLCSTVDYELEYAQILQSVGPEVFAKVMRVAPADPSIVLPGFMSRYWAGPEVVRAAAAASSAGVPGAAARWIRQVPGPVVSGALERLERVRALVPFLGKSASHSNNWVVSGRYTESGYPFVCNDPHLSMLAPSNFLLVHLDATTFGQGRIHIAGGAIAGLPGILLGHNDSVAWAQTAMLYDATDLYVETIIPGRRGGPDAVLFNGAAVPMTRVKERFRLGMRPESPVEELTVEVVPHHGPLLPGSRQGLRAMSLKWVGYQPEAFTDVLTFLGLLTAATTDDVFEALGSFRTGSGNWVFADRNGTIGYSGHSLVPIRNNQRDYPPYLPMPGTGEAEWIGYVPEAKLPWAVDPEAGFITSSNNDAVGTTLDNDPLNDEYYLYYCRKLGFRARRIEDRLRQGIQRSSGRGGLTMDDMAGIQADTVSLAGARFVPFILEAYRARGDRFSSASARLAEALERLARWDFSTPTGLPAGFREAPPDDREIDNSVACSIFHAWLNRFVQNSLGDEFGAQPLPGSHGEDGPQFEVKALLHALEDGGDASLFDDTRTPEVVETADGIILKSLVEALDTLQRLFNTADMGEWRWGSLHTATFAFGMSDIVLPDSISPVLGPYPNDGANFTVDVGNQAGLGDTFSQVHCPQMRFITEVRPPEFPTRIVIPCGQSGVRGDRHFDDLMPLWLNNQYVDLAFTPQEVIRAMENHLVFVP